MYIIYVIYIYVYGTTVLYTHFAHVIYLLRAGACYMLVSGIFKQWLWSVLL